METKKFTQTGKISLVIVGIVLLFILGSAIQVYVQANYKFVPELLTLLLPTVGLLFILIMMSKLEITVDERFVGYRFGGGIWKGKYKLENIKSCEAVTNPWWTGYGIRWILNGWLYNVSGNKAIELKFHDKKGVVRIGTDQPEEVAALIQSRLTVNPNYDYSTTTKLTSQNSWQTPLKVFGVLFIIGILALAAYPEFVDTQTSLQENKLVIAGMYGFGIPYAKIKTIDTLDGLPKVSYRSNGYGGTGTLLGNFVMKDGSDAKLFIRKGFTPVLRITTNDKTVYLNHREHGKTVALYEALKTKISLAK